MITMTISLLMLLSLILKTIIISFLSLISLISETTKNNYIWNLLIFVINNEKVI